MTLGPVRVIGAGMALMTCVEEVSMYVSYFMWLLVSKLFVSYLVGLVHKMRYVFLYK